MTRVVHRRRWTLDDRAESMWHTLPVEIPPGCDGLSVRLEGPVADDVVVDLGCDGTSGWRGWSGGARRDFGITPAAATPGYLPGELEPGTWHVVIGLHRLPLDGVELTVTAETGPIASIPGRADYDRATAEVMPPDRLASPLPDSTLGASARSASSPLRGSARGLAAPAGLRWVACDFHGHTLHSDGSLPVAAVAALARSAGLDVMAITDHNTVAHHAELAATGRRLGIGLLPGQEVTTDAGHANAFGPIGWVDFRRPPAEWATAVSADGGLLSINHPLGGDCSWRHPLPADASLAEIWHSSWLDPRWTGPLAWWQSRGASTVPIGGSDWHRPGSDASPGRPTTWVCVDDAAESTDELVVAVLDGLRAGRTAISASSAAPVLFRHDDELMLDAGSVELPPLLVTGLDGSRRKAPRPGTTLTASGHGHVLIGHDGAVVSISR